MNRFYSWLFRELPLPAKSWRVILWWEARRIPFNICIAPFGIAGLFFYYTAVDRFHMSLSSQDQIVDLALLVVVPFFINAFYTLGWLIEVPARLAFKNLGAGFGPKLLKGGLCLVLIPLILCLLYWIGYPFLRNVGWAA